MSIPVCQEMRRSSPPPYLPLPSRGTCNSNAFGADKSSLPRHNPCRDLHANPPFFQHVEVCLIAAKATPLLAETRNLGIMYSEHITLWRIKVEGHRWELVGTFTAAAQVHDAFSSIRMKLSTCKLGGPDTGWICLLTSISCPKETAGQSFPDSLFLVSHNLWNNNLRNAKPQLSACRC